MRKIPEPPDLGQVLQSHRDTFGSALQDPGYEEVVARCQLKYRHWDKVRFIARSAGLNPEVTWALVRMGRQLQPLPLKSAAGERLRFGLPDVVQREIMLIDQQLAGRLELDEDAAISAENRDRFIRSSLMEEAIASSRLEGASTTVRQAKEMLRADQPPRDRSEQMIVNNYRAIGFIREHSGTPLTPEFLIELQRVLTIDTLDEPDKAGRLRRPDESVVVEDAYGELLHDPPPADQLEPRLEALCEFANQTSQQSGPFIHPVVRAVALHFQLAYDHPFCDGNGRTARAVFYWSMLRQGYWLLEYMPISRLIYRGPSLYGRAFLYVETDRFDLTYFLVYHARILRQARHDLREHLAKKSREAKTARSTFATLDVNRRQRSLLMHALEHPNAVYTIERHQRTEGVSYFTARADLLGLQKMGFFALHRSGKKHEFLPTGKIADAARASSERY